MSCGYPTAAVYDYLCSAMPLSANRISDCLKQLNFGPKIEVAVRTILAPRPDEVAENQDNFLLIDAMGRTVFLRGQRPVLQQVEGWPLGHVRLALMDGMGGHRNGREVAEAIANGLTRIPAARDLQTLNAALETLHRQIQAGYPEKPLRPGATLLLLEFPPDSPTFLFHVGDSRLVQVSHDAVRILTVDHVPATACALRNEIDETDWRNQVQEQNRSVVSQAFVLGNMLENPSELADELYDLNTDRLPSFLRTWPDRRSIVMDPDSVYVLASDGMWSFLDPQAWIRRWPQILHGSQKSLQSRLDDLFIQHIIASAEEVDIDNSTAIAVSVRP